MTSSNRSRSADHASLRRWLLAILCLAVIVRVGTFSVNHPFPPLAKDDSVYDALGWNLLNGHGFTASSKPPYEPLVYRTPGYPAFLAMTYAVAGHDPDAARLLQIAVSLATLVIVYMLARRLMSGQAALLATGVYALCPAAALYPSLVLTESNQALLVVLALYLAYRVADEPRPAGFVALAVVLAVAALCRPDYMFLIVPVTAAIWLVGPRDRRTASGLALAWICFGAFIAPWMYRNYTTFGVMGLATGTGHTVIAAKLEAEGKTGPALYQALDDRYGAAFQAKYGRRMTYIDGALPDQDALRRKDFVAFVKAEPVGYAKQSLARVRDLWQPRSWSEVAGLKRDFSEYRSEREFGSLAAKAALLAWDGLLILLAAVGTLFALTDWRRFAVVLVPLCYSSVIHGLVYSGARYRVPLMPVVAVLATYGLLQAFLRVAALFWRTPTDDDWQVIAGESRSPEKSVAL
jgi:4-amino-4-deoxy-L-arabinose transferase-like glycosyltransferase